MPHKVGKKWRWGNIERDSKKELSQTVYGIWKKNGSKGSFEDFWKTGKTDESIERVDYSKMLDFRVNRIIQEAYGKVRRNVSGIDMAGFVNEDEVNSVPYSVSMPTGELNRANVDDSTRSGVERPKSLLDDERKIADRLGAESVTAREVEKRQEERHNREKRRIKYILNRRRDTPVMTASTPRYEKRPIMYNPNSEEGMQISGRAFSDPTLRLSDGIKTGMSVAAPLGMASAAGGVAKGGKLLRGILNPYYRLIGVNRKNFWWKLPAQVVGSKEIENAVNKKADDLEKNGEKGKAKLLRSSSPQYFITPAGVATRWLGGMGIEYLQDEFGNSETAKKVGKLQDIIGADSDYSQNPTTDARDTENTTDATNATGGESENGADDAGFPCPECGFKAKTLEELVDHCESVHDTSKW